MSLFIQTTKTGVAVIRNAWLVIEGVIRHMVHAVGFSLGCGKFLSWKGICQAKPISRMVLRDAIFPDEAGNGKHSNSGKAQKQQNFFPIFTFHGFYPFTNSIRIIY